MNWIMLIFLTDCNCISLKPTVISAHENQADEEIIQISSRHIR